MQAILIFSAVAGESNLNMLSKFSCSLADLIASLIAKKIDAAKNNGGSPTALKKKESYDF